MRAFIPLLCLAVTGCAPAEPTRITYEMPQTTIVRTTVIREASPQYRYIPARSDECPEVFHPDGDAQKIEQRIQADLRNLGVSERQIEQEVRSMRRKVCR